MHPQCSCLRGCTTEVYGQTARIALVHFRHSTGQRILPFDQFYLEGVEGTSPQLLYPPKDLLSLQSLTISQFTPKFKLAEMSRSREWRFLPPNGELRRAPSRNHCSKNELGQLGKQSGTLSLSMRTKGRGAWRKPWLRPSRLDIGSLEMASLLAGNRRFNAT